MILGFGNNVVSSLASDITASQTTISIMPGDGPLFSALLTSDFSNKSTTLKNYAKITLTDSGETAFEVCHLISVSGDTLTVIRGQEGTLAKGWSLKDVIANFSTRGSENAFTQIAHIQSGFYTSGTAGGSANALTLELPSTFFLNGSTDWALKTPVVVYPSQNNTGAATLQLTMGGRVLGTFPLYKGNKAQLTANDILKDVALVCLMDNTKTFFSVANPGAIYAGLGTAAFKDIVTSMTDASAGRIPVVGWMGLGGNAPRTAVVATDSYDNIPTNVPSGFWTHTVSGGPFAYTFTLRQDGGGAINDRHFIIPSNSNGKIALRWDSGNTFSYQYFYTDKNKPTPGEIGALPVAGGAMTGIITTSSDGRGSFASQLGSKSPVYQEINTTATSEYWPIVKQKYIQGNSAWSIGTLVNPGGLQIYYSAPNSANDKNFSFQTDGQLILPNYANFDARYQAKGSYGKPNTASKASNGWWKCGDTGVIRQWGVVAVGDNQVVTANFPIAFPTACTSLVVTARSQSGNTEEQVVSAYGIAISRSQMRVSMSVNYVIAASGICFIAEGY